MHCAGGNPAIGRPPSATLEEEAALLEETLAGNLVSAALTVTALDEAMGEGAAIVLLGSIAAERGVGYYGPAKAAVASYAVGLAAALGSRGIRVNCLSPGYIAGTEFFAGTMTDERAEALRAHRGARGRRRRAPLPALGSEPPPDRPEHPPRWRGLHHAIGSAARIGDI